MRIIERETGTPESETPVVWCENDICEERASNGTTVLKRAFNRGEQIGTSARFAAIDHLTSVVTLTDAIGVELAAYSFDPFGRRVKTFGSDDTSVGFTSHQSHSRSGLALTLNRSYDAELGRWLSEDPIGIEDGPNMYGYVANRPTVWADPLGLQKCCNELAQRRQRLHQILDQLEAGQEPRGVIGGVTICAGNIPDPIDTRFIKMAMGPCLAECAIAHEKRHAEQCRRFGNMESYVSSSRAHERSAYLVELGCVIRKLRTLSCEVCK